MWNTILSWLPESWIENIARKMIGVWITKLCTAIAAAAATHGASQLSNPQNHWASVTADAIITLLMGWLSTYLSNLRHTTKDADIAVALATPPSAAPVFLRPATITMQLPPATEPLVQVSPVCANCAPTQRVPTGPTGTVIADNTPIGQDRVN